MFGYIYLTTNNINNHKYIGQHKANSFQGSKYLGSGTALLLAIEKYGKENFTIEMLKECQTKEELDEQEQYYIRFYNAQEDPNFYNISKGGEAGPGGPMFKGHKHSEETRLAMSANRRGSNNSNFGNRWTEEQKQMQRERIGDRYKGEGNPNYGKRGKDSPNYGRQFSKERNAKIAEKRKTLTYITNGILNKAVTQDKLNSYLEDGWYIGRISRKKYPLNNGRATTIESIA